MTLIVRAHEAGFVRVFALSMDAQTADLFKGDPAAQQSALGVAYLDPDFTEIFPIADLGDLGLAGYLSTGNGIPAAQLDPDRAKLAALEGWVMLVFSNAFGDFATTIKPGASLTHIGTYAEDGVDWSPVSIETDATDLYTGPDTPMPATPSGRGLNAILLAIAAAIAVVLLFILSR